MQAQVDRDRRPGRFLLTGSAHVLRLPRLADTLTGRMELVELWPLSQGEIRGRREGFVDRLFAAPREWPVKSQGCESPAESLDSSHRNAGRFAS